MSPIFKSATSKIFETVHSHNDQEPFGGARKSNLMFHVQINIQDDENFFQFKFDKLTKFKYQTTILFLWKRLIL